jgi:hypothetical protein
LKVLEKTCTEVASNVNKNFQLAVRGLFCTSRPVDMHELVHSWSEIFVSIKAKMMFLARSVGPNDGRFVVSTTVDASKT